MTPTVAPYNVRFLCTGNTARSIMAECILDREGAGRFRAFSAGSHPTGAIDPLVLSLLRRLDFDTSALRSKGWDEFAAAPALRIVFTVCDDAAGEVCPVWRGQPMTAHWGVPDPGAATGSLAERAAMAADVCRMLNARISIFVSLPLASLDRLTLTKRLTEIGQTRDAPARADG